MRKISRFGLFENKRQLRSNSNHSVGGVSALSKPKECNLFPAYQSAATSSSIIADAVVASGACAGGTSAVFASIGQTKEDILSFQKADPRISKRPRHTVDDLGHDKTPIFQERRSIPIDSSIDRVASDSSNSDDETDALEALLSSSYAGGNDSSKIDMIWTMYEKQRRLYKKYKKRSDKAQEDMYRLTKVLRHLENMDKKQNSAYDISLIEYSFQTQSQLQSSPVQQLESSQQTEASLTANVKASNLGSDCFSSDSESIKSPLVDPNKSAWQTVQSNNRKVNSGRIDTVSRSNGILSAEKPIQAFQFSTQTIKAFQLKPRAATVCTFDGMSGQTAVAYGFDGTVQFWDPSTREQLLSIGKEDLQMDMVDKVSQLTPSLIAVLAGGSAKGGVYDNKGSIALLSKERQLEPNTLQFRPPAYCTDSPHSGEISVVEGMPGFGGNNDDNRNNNPAFMLSGGEADKGVYMWAIGLSEQGAVTAIQQTHKMKTRHTTRITALCYEPFKGYAISGADGNGRINVNNVETGKLVVDNDHRQCGGGIGGISICPVDANLAMVCCTTKGKQVQIFDLRQSLSVLKPALLLGKDEGFRNSRYIRSAWHPDGRLVFCPLNEEGTKASGSGTVFIWDVRYVRCQEEEPQTYNPHSGSIWSACFARPSQTAESNNPMLVTVSSDRKIAFTDFSI